MRIAALLISAGLLLLLLWFKPWLPWLSRVSPSAPPAPAVAPAASEGAQRPAPRIVTEGEFAVDLVRTLGLEFLLPLGATQLDYVRVLEQQGIQPLRGWDVRRTLTRDAFNEAIIRARGDEAILFQYAQDRCDNAVYYANRFARGSSQDAPACPFGLPFQDRNRDERIDAHRHLKGLLQWVLR